MKLDQFIGPFKSNNTIIFSRPNVTYLQIGIEHPHSVPISEIEENNNNIQWPLIVGINKGTSQSEHDYIITDKNILELELNHETVSVIVYKNLDPYLIINVAYEDAN